MRDVLRLKRALEKQGITMRVPREMTPYERERPRMPPIRLRPGWFAFLIRWGLPERWVDLGDRWLKAGEHQPEFHEWEPALAAWEARRPADEDLQVRRMEEKLEQEWQELLASEREAS